jgi:pilus assembly protein TadC
MPVDPAALTVMLVLSLITATVLLVITTAGYGVVYSF